MSVLRIVCRLILCFHVNQGFAINLPWPARKNKQHFELFEVFLTSSADQWVFIFIFAIADSTLKEYENMQLRFIIFLCTQGYNSLRYTTLYYEVWGINV